MLLKCEFNKCDYRCYIFSRNCHPCEKLYIKAPPTGWCRLISKIKNHVYICAVSYVTVITATILLKLLKCVTSRVSHNKFYTLSRRRMKSSLALMHEDSDGNFLCRIKIVKQSHLCHELEAKIIFFSCAKHFLKIT